jgi:hypothetical protein
MWTYPVVYTCLIVIEEGVVLMLRMAGVVFFAGAGRVGGIRAGRGQGTGIYTTRALPLLMGPSI